ncbi:hypothetical protein GCM10012275_26870 [Longimycelium tulufanense]|uniref:Uncharacterized protein n=1 Tax=Longimycelium tulufanense TaxID=907463 RepID=A0A8J3C8H3_9PSEU|nr:hypothetical protein [Longimycelium tulufanense]GGM54351.1 hypothetical protein GCM10012275_26870 [Longimycelium tulufanense]
MRVTARVPAAVLALVSLVLLTTPTAHAQGPGPTPGPLDQLVQGVMGVLPSPVSKAVGESVQLALFRPWSSVDGHGQEDGAQAQEQDGQAQEH